MAVLLDMLFSIVESHNSSDMTSHPVDDRAKPESTDKSTPIRVSK